MCPPWTSVLELSVPSWWCSLGEVIELLGWETLLGGVHDLGWALRVYGFISLLIRLLCSLCVVGTRFLSFLFRLPAAVLLLRLWRFSLSGTIGQNEPLLQEIAFGLWYFLTARKKDLMQFSVCHWFNPGIQNLKVLETNRSIILMVKNFQVNFV